MKQTEATFFECTADSNDSAITADEILQEISSGKSVYITGARIDGSLKLSDLTLKGELVFRHCLVTEKLAADNVVFERNVELSGTTFEKGCTCQAATFRKSLVLTKSTFHGSDFAAAQVEQAINASDAQFLPWKENPNNIPDFSFFAAKVQVGMILNRATVRGHSNCSFLEVSGNLVCAGVKFSGSKAFFDTMKVLGDVNFNGAVFDVETTFSRAEITGSLGLTGAKFLRASPPEEIGSSTRYVNTFYFAKIGGDLSIDGAYFKGNTSFAGSETLGDCYFGKKFELGGGNFYGEGSTFDAKLYCSGCNFLGDVHYSGIAAKGGIDLTSASFAKRVALVGDFGGLTKLTSAKFDGEVVFSGKFVGGITFFRSQFLGPLFFSGDCTVMGPANFKEAKLTSIHFVKGIEESVATPFQGKLDLRQCRYERLMYEGNLEDLWLTLRSKLRQQALETETKYEFDIQPYQQLQQVFRSQGRDELADDVYYEMRELASGFETRPVFRIWDFLERLLFGWGARPVRMLIGALLVWMIGTFVLMRQNGLIPSETHGITVARQYAAALISGNNQCLGLGELKSLGLQPNWADPFTAVWLILQRAVGLIFFALLSRRFFAGLSRPASDK